MVRTKVVHSILAWFLHGLTENGFSIVFLARMLQGVGGGVGPYSDHYLGFTLLGFKS